MTFSYNKSFRLKDQTRVAFRLVEPEDRIRLLNGFNRISARTNINRFHSFKKRLNENELNYLLSIDNVNHLAIGAIDCDNSDELGIGLVRYIRMKEAPDQAEVAITIIDEYQGKGLGSILYREMMKMAAQNDINTLLNIVRKDNRAMLYLLDSLGAKKVTEHEQVYEFTVDLINIKQLSNLTLIPEMPDSYYCKPFPDRNNKSSVRNNRVATDAI